MGVFRALLLVLLLAAVACFVAYAWTGDLRHRAWGVRLVRWTVGTGLAFFAILIAIRLTESG